MYVNLSTVVGMLRALRGFLNKIVMITVTSEAKELFNSSRPKITVFIKAINHDDEILTLYAVPTLQATKPDWAPSEKDEPLYLRGDQILGYQEFRQ